MLDSALRRVPGMLDAVKRGDWDTAKQLATQSTLEGVMSAGAGQQATADLSPEVRTLRQPSSNSDIAQETAQPTAAPAETAPLRPVRGLLRQVNPTPQETIAGQPINVRMFPSDEAPLITPEPVRTPTGAIMARPSRLSTLKALPEARGPEPDEATDFLSGRPTAVPPIPSAPRIGVLEDYARGYQPRFADRASAAEPAAQNTEAAPMPNAAKISSKPARAAQAAEPAFDFRPLRDDEPAPTLPREPVNPRALVEAKGLQWVGIQEGAGSVPDQVLARDPKTGTTIAVPREGITPTAIDAKLKASRAEYEPKPAAPEAEPWPSAEMTRSANLTFGQLRKNPVEQQFARDVWQATIARERSPEPPAGMPLSRAPLDSEQARGDLHRAIASKQAQSGSTCHGPVFGRRARCGASAACGGLGLPRADATSGTLPDR